MTPFRSTTILAVRHQGAVAIGGDGQVTLGSVVMKSDARKIRRLHQGRVLAGFAFHLVNQLGRLMERPPGLDCLALLVLRHGQEDVYRARQGRITIFTTLVARIVGHRKDLVEP